MRSYGPLRLIGICTLVIAYSLSQQALGQTQMTYTSFDGEELVRYAYVGDEIAVLVDSPDYDASVMNEIVATFDRAYDYYFQATGRHPATYFTYQGRATIAQVSSTCGAGCGYLGATGIEILDSTWSLLYEGVRDRGEFDQVVFYELGRNFWFYESKIGLVAPDPNPIPTGFAVAMRFESMDAAGVDGGPFNGIDFNVFRSQVRGLIDEYLADEELNFNNTIRVGESPVGWGATDLFASFYLRLADEFGLSFKRNFWKEVGALPDRNSTQDAVDNMAIAASLAADENLGSRFSQDWRWPVSQDALDQIDQTFQGNPQPDGIELQGGLSGSWYDPSRNGEGFVLDFSSTTLGNVLSIYWFTHRDGEPYWLIGTTSYSPGSREIAIDLYEVSGTGFGADFDADEISQTQWGSITLAFDSCSSGSASWSHNGSLGSGQFDLSRIALELDGVACN
jgi:hypothetical protein